MIKYYLKVSLTMMLVVGSFYLVGQTILYDSIDPVIITATKLEVKQSVSNKEVIIIDQNKLNDYAGYSLPQVLNQISGIQINGALSNPSKDKSVYIRGAKNDYTVILIDGIPLQDPSGVGGAIDLRLLHLDQVDRIEILKGAQTSLYGSDAIAGVINIITRSSYDHRWNGNLSLGLGSFGLREGHTSWAYHEGDHTVGLQLGAGRSTGLSEATDTTAKKMFDKDGFDFFNAQLYYEVNIAKKWKVRPYYRYSRFKGEYDAGGYMDSDEDYKASLHSFGLKTDVNYTKGSITIQGNSDQIDRLFHTQFGDYDYKGTSHFVESYGHYRLSKNHTLLAGLDIRQYSIVDDQATPLNPKVNIISPYGSWMAAFGKLSLQTDIRYTHHPINQKVTYSFNPAWTLIPDRLKIKFSHGTGFKSPTLSQLFGQWGANPLLKPESGTTTEGGLYFTSPHRHWKANLVFFQRSIHDLIAYTSHYINIDRQDDHGIELESSVIINRYMTVGAQYAYLQGKLSTNTAMGDTSYANLLRRPAHRLQVKADYKPASQWSIHSAASLNSKSSDFDFNTYPATPVTLKSYLVIDAGAQYTFSSDRNKLYVQFFNLLNARYQEVFGYNNRPISIQIGWTIKFEK